MPIVRCSSPVAGRRRSLPTQAERGPGDIARRLVLVLNAGSSSLKASVLDAGRPEPLAQVAVDWGSDATMVADRRATVRTALAQIESAGVPATQLSAAGHRVVHGGLRFRSSTLIDDAVMDELERLVPLAPLHNGVALDTIRAQLELLPGIPAVASFDTAFHATLPPAAHIYPLPWAWYAEWGIRRFGFHGLSVEWSAGRSAELLGGPAAELCVVVAHLGSGCSVTAVEAGRSVATSMGFTPLEGLMMGTRSGSFDPGIALDVRRHHELDDESLGQAIEHESGLLAISGVSGDMRAVEQAAAAGNERARLAFDMFVARAAEGIAAAASALPRLDALVFTGGIGEHSAKVRNAIVARLAVLGIAPLEATDIQGDGLLSSETATIAVLRIEAREDVVIAESVARLLWNDTPSC
jgi:acetate kinase